ncbi:helix-turn-helix domain-containing protein [Vibrio hannami]|uniref:helix-turn-helix domain-containing protein n=1 Tax=Vibrio hannami TaxID=2717094 RepID=UPI0024101FBA|nr:helix-turn-helix domain-containing protein [Vibrio hannami]MDG3088129.1 helix-turn-helix domain-containing protein [Vibrio hannami]
MITTIELLEAFKEEMDVPSDYAAAKLLNVSPQAVSYWRNGKAMSEETAIMMARILKLDEDLVILSNLAERQHSEKAKEALMKIIAS